MENKYKVIATPTDNSNLDGKLLRYCEPHGLFPEGYLKIGNSKCIKEVWQVLELHIVDDTANIKEGEYVMIDNSIIRFVTNLSANHFHCDGIITGDEPSSFYYHDKHAKIIASTDKTLLLPEIPQTLLQQIVEKQQIPEYVDLKDEDDTKCRLSGFYNVGKRKISISPDYEVIINETMKENLKTFNKEFISEVLGMNVNSDKHLLPEHYS